MSQKKLIKQLKKKYPKFNKTELAAIVDVFFDSITRALKLGKPVEIRNLGRFYCRKLNENYNLRNPSTSELIYRPNRVKVKFRASTGLGFSWLSPFGPVKFYLSKALIKENYDKTEIFRFSFGTTY